MPESVLAEETDNCLLDGSRECRPQLGHNPVGFSTGSLDQRLLVCALVGLFQLAFSVTGTHVELFLSSCKTDSVLG